MTQTAILKPLPATGLRDNVTQALLVAILSGDFVQGDRLVVQTLAKQLEVSATPVREALVALAAYGMVELLPNRGAVVCPFGPKELAEIYQLRRILEAEATRQACGNIPVPQLKTLLADLKELQAHWSPRKSKRTIELDCLLHDQVAHHCGSQRLINEIKRYHDLSQAIRDVIGNQRHTQEIAVGEHIVIVQALLKNKPAQAAQAMDHHIQRVANTIVETMFPE